MKLVLLALLVALCVSSSIVGKNNLIEFEVDSNEDSPVSIVMKGSINPRYAEQNNVQAFLKLANTYIPVLQGLANADKNLKYERYWNINVAGINLNVYWYFQLIVGWRAQPGSSSSNFYEVTYTPFVFGETSGRVNGTTWPAVGSSRAQLQYVLAYAPIAVTLYREGRVCFRARYVIEPIMFKNNVFAALQECQAEIIDEIINSVPIHLNCNYTAPVNITLFNVNFTESFSDDIIGETCIGN